CAGGNSWVCLADSAVYGTPDELSRRFGDAQLKQLRDAARAAQYETVRGWVSASPNTARARAAAVRVLLAGGRYDEATREADALARLGARADAGIWKAAILVQQGRPGAAAAALDSTLKTATDSFPQVSSFSALGNFTGI